MKNRLRVQRAIKEITQQQLADAVGVSRQTINSIEIRKYYPSGLLTLQLANYFGTRVEDIFYLEEDELIIKSIDNKDDGRQP
jgi:putative transcriptional regulator